MRVNLLTQSASTSSAGMGTIPLSLTIRPACGLPGDFSCPTDSTALLSMLLLETDLPSTVLRRFERDIISTTKARLLNVELSDRALTNIGYFID